MDETFDHTEAYQKDTFGAFLKMNQACEKSLLRTAPYCRGALKSAPALWKESPAARNGAAQQLVIHND
jgi:hypothetical protein